MKRHNVVMAGLPKSGKTTFLAALWHLVRSREIATVLKFHSLQQGDYEHLNTIAKRWRDAEPQIRTEIRFPKFVQMHLQDAAQNEVRLSFPDLSGEAYRIMWEQRGCLKDVKTTASEGGALLLLVNADSIKRPLWITEEFQQKATLGLVSEEEDSKEIPWDPSQSPTQVKLVDILQMLQESPLTFEPNKVAIGLSAWDTVVEEGRAPITFLKEELPLLWQYLETAFGPSRYRVYGISAQGGEIEEMTATDRPNAEALRGKDVASERILVVDEQGNMSNDLTIVLQWLV